MYTPQHKNLWNRESQKTKIKIPPFRPKFVTKQKTDLDKLTFFTKKEVIFPLCLHFIKIRKLPQKMGTHYGLLKLHITDNSVLGRKKAVYLPTKTSRCQFCPVTIVWGTTAIPRGTLESIKYFNFRSNIQNIVTPVMEFAFKLNQHYTVVWSVYKFYRQKFFFYQHCL